MSSMDSSSMLDLDRPKKKIKRSRLEDELFVKDSKLSKRGRIITFRSCGNIGHNKSTCKGQGQQSRIGVNNAKASGSPSGQAEVAIGQYGLGVVITSNS
ncbi:hypothetical protein Tco_0992532 [Tanacetum coccineum]|uniref:Uncharacterized protein n=1 Tax=Tanacetum coccineum TaxID=301880 RepID=A0ABQ5F2D2_9ASTR